MTVTDNGNHGDTFTITELVSGSIEFFATSRTFSVNGAANTSGNSGSVSLFEINSVVFNDRTGNNTIKVGAFTNPSFPSLTLNGNTGSDIFNFTGNITFASDSSLSVNGAPAARTR
jgi:hypothetical protein